MGSFEIEGQLTPVRKCPALNCNSTHPECGEGFTCAWVEEEFPELCNVKSRDLLSATNNGINFFDALRKIGLLK
jgi:hypothetical protein